MTIGWGCLIVIEWDMGAMIVGKTPSSQYPSQLQLHTPPRQSCNAGGYMSIEEGCLIVIEWDMGVGFESQYDCR